MQRTFTTLAVFAMLLVALALCVWQTVTVFGTVSSTPALALLLLQITGAAAIIGISALLIRKRFVG